MAEGKEQSVLVIGAGVGGVKASLELAESGLKVYLCDLSPDIGGTLMQMDKWFPNSMIEHPPAAGKRLSCS